MKPQDDGFVLLKEYKNGGKLYEHILVDKKSSDYSDLLLLGSSFALMGKIVEVLPRLHYKDPQYGKIFKGAYERKNPDLKIDGLFFEFKSYVGDWNDRKLSNMLSHGSEQAAKLIIDVRKSGVTECYLEFRVKDRIMKGLPINELWSLTDKGILKIYPIKKP